MENQIFELQYALDTFYFLICGALVMWMAAGFSMLEAGLVRSKNTTEILTKNVALFAISCTMYMIIGYELMYGGGIGWAVAKWTPQPDLAVELLKELAGAEGQQVFLTTAGAMPAHGDVDLTLITDPNAKQIIDWVGSGNTMLGFFKEPSDRHNEQKLNIEQLGLGEITAEELIDNMVAWQEANQ